MRAVHVLFYRPQPDDLWLNHVVTFVSPPYSHCDIQFENEVTSSIYQHETVYMEKKSLSRLNFERISVKVTFATIRLRNGLAKSRLSLLTFEPFYSARAAIPDLADVLCIQAA